jgi:Domain of unknown function (DUF4365)
MLDAAAKAEQLSLAYVRAVASAAGFAVEHRSIDRDGIDLSIHAKGLLSPESTLLSPTIDIQVKASKNVGLGVDWLRYDLEAKNYRLLNGRYGTPRFLVLLELPESENDWLSWSAEQLTLRRTAWWVSLHGAPDTQNTATIRVWVPKGQVFSPENVADLLARSSRQESINFVPKETPSE